MAIAKTTTPKAPTAAEKRIDARIEATVKEVIKGEFDHYLKDLSFRIGQAYDLLERNANGASVNGKVYAEDLNLPGRAFITGYTTTNNSPAAGSFAWADLHIVYNGVDTLVTNGSTANKYVWWSSITTPTVLQSGPAKPNLVNGEVLLFVNEAGTPRVMLSDTNASMPAILRDGAVDSGSIVANAVGSAAIADNAVGQAQIGPNAITSTELSDGAVVRAGQMAANVVTTTQLADNAVDAAAIALNAVTSTKLADGAVVRSAQLSGNVVTSTALADGAVVRAGQLSANVVTTTAIADNAVTVTELNANAVTAAKLADGAVVRATQLTNNVVTTTAIAPNAVTTAELATGTVTAAKMNVLRHFMF